MAHGIERWVREARHTGCGRHQDAVAAFKKEMSDRQNADLKKGTQKAWPARPTIEEYYRWRRISQQRRELRGSAGTVDRTSGGWRTFYCTREALKLIQAQRYGRIVNLASIAGFSAISAHTYSATKDAVIAFTKSVATEVVGSNVLVNALTPDGISTPFLEQYPVSMGEEARRWFSQVIAAGRFGTMDECAWVATFVAGDHYFAGLVLSPNGGAVLLRCKGRRSSCAVERLRHDRIRKQIQNVLVWQL